MRYRFIIYLILVLLLPLIYFIKYKKKESKYQLIKNIVLIISLTSYIYALALGGYSYNITYLNCVLTISCISLLIYSYAMIINKNKVYKKNIDIYIILYYLILTSITMYVNRIDLKFSFNNINRLHSEYLIPFNTITRILFSDVELDMKIYNIVGNLLLFVPLSLLLILKDKKYNNYLKQMKIIFPTILIIEITQLFTRVGTFDVDDIILNNLGVIIFLYLINKFKLIDKITIVFNKSYKIKYILFYSSIFLLLILTMKIIIISIERMIIFTI